MKQWSLGKRGEAALWHYGKLHETHDEYDVKMLRQFKTKQEQEVKGDFEVSWDGNILNVDAKVEDLRSPNFPIEICQDRKTENGGWFDKLVHCHAIWYAQVEDDNPATVYSLKFFSIWRISLARLREQFADTGTIWERRSSSRGWGDTAIVLAPLSQLEEYGTAIHWWGERQ